MNSEPLKYRSTKNQDNVSDTAADLSNKILHLHTVTTSYLLPSFNLLHSLQVNALSVHHYEQIDFTPFFIHIFPVSLACLYIHILLHPIILSLSRNITTLPQVRYIAD